MSATELDQTGMILSRLITLTEEGLRADVRKINPKKLQQILGSDEENHWMLMKKLKAVLESYREAKQGLEEALGFIMDIDGERLDKAMVVAVDQEVTKPVLNLLKKDHWKEFMGMCGMEYLEKYVEQCMQRSRDLQREEERQEKKAKKRRARRTRARRRRRSDEP